MEEKKAPNCGNGQGAVDDQGQTIYFPRFCGYRLLLKTVGTNADIIGAARPRAYSALSV